MKKLMLLWLLTTFSFYHLLAQNCQTDCNLIQNPCLTGPKKKVKSSSDPLKPSVNLVSPWDRTHGSPSFKAIQPLSQKTALELVNQTVRRRGRILKHSEGYTQNISLKKGREYVVAINAYKHSGKITDTLFVGFTNGKPGFAGRFGYPSNYEHVVLNQPIANTSYQLFANCFIPDSSYPYIWIHTKPIANQPVGVAYRQIMGTDDVELIENFDFALQDTTVCQPGTPIGLSTKCDDFLNFSASYEWRRLSDNAFIGATRNVTVSPMVTTQYVCKRTLSDLPGCPGYDTITVAVNAMPIMLDLGPDTSICSPSILVLDADYHGPFFTYEWHKNQVPNLLGTNQTYTVTTSGRYIVIVKDTVNGCAFRDTINVTVNPEVRVYPDTTFICDSLTQFGVFDAGGGFVTYKWNNDPMSTNRTYTTNVPGIHIVEVSDTNGCIGIDTAVLIYRDFKFKLPNDTVICEGECVFVPVKTDSAYVSYLWSDGNSDTSRTICSAGSYLLTITDSLGCSYTDTVNIFVHAQPPLNLPDYGPLCFDDTFTVLGRPTSHQDGVFDNEYEYLDSFWLGNTAARPGIHKVYYRFIDIDSTTWPPLRSECPFTDSFNVLVAPLDSIYIDTLGPLCLNAPNQPLIGTPPGGTFKDSTGATIDSFLASDYGVGTHLITYTYADSNGCKYTTKTWVQVTEPPQISFGFDSSYCIPAYGMAVWAKYDTLEFPDLKYLWSNGDTTKNSRYHCSDTLILYTYTIDSTCFSIDTFVTELQCCCDLPSSFNPEDDLTFTHENPLDWNTQTLVIDRDVKIDSGYIAQIIDCTIIMKNCARLIVDKGAHLEIIDSEIGFCEWEGIEVWGEYDACSNDWTQQGKLVINNTEVNSANVGIMLGARDYTIDARFAYQRAGGVVEADDCHFIGNYVDVLITPWTWAGLCTCTGIPGGDEWHTYFKNCDFDTLANDYICDPFVNVILDSLNAYHDYTSPDPPKYCDINFGFWGGNFNVQSRCHIIDLSPYIDYWINRPGSGINCWDACAHNSWQGSDDITDPFPYGNPNSYSGRTFDGSIIDCDQIAPHSNHD